MIDCAKIKEIADRELAGTDMFTVSCTCTPSNEVELLIDSDTSVTPSRRTSTATWRTSRSRWHPQA